MDVSGLLMLLAVLAFCVVSLAFSINLIVNVYLEYIQVTTGIRVVTQQQMEEMMEDDDELSDR